MVDLRPLPLGAFPLIWIIKWTKWIDTFASVLCMSLCKNPNEKHSSATHMNGYWINLRQQNDSLSTLLCMICEKCAMKLLQLKNLCSIFIRELSSHESREREKEKTDEKGKLKKFHCQDGIVNISSHKHTNVLTSTWWTPNNSEHRWWEWRCACK